MILETSWPLFLVFGASLPGLAFLGRFLGDGEDATEQSNDVDDLLDDTFDEGAVFDDSLEGDGDDMDPFGGSGEGDVAQLEGDLEEVSEEVNQLSSKMSTVRSENEEIADIVGELEGDIRKLLEIYEMVTRGINPFVDDDTGMGGGGGFSGGDGFTVFESVEQQSSPTESNLDDEVLDADPEAFFDDSALDEGVDDIQEPVDARPPAEPSPPSQSPTQEPHTTDDDAKRFDDLKEEYETGEGEWGDDSNVAADSPSPEPPAESDMDAVPQDVGQTNENTDDPSARKDGAPGETHPEQAMPASGNGRSSVTGGKKPYLSSLPTEPIGEVTLFEWLESLVVATDIEGAQGTIRYYGDIGWIDAGVLDGLEEYLAGFGPISADTDPIVPTSLGQDAHIQSLQYLMQIENSSTGAFVGERLDQLAPHESPLEADDSADQATLEFLPAPGRATATTDIDSEPGVTLPDGGFGTPPGLIPAPEVGEDGD